jgi:hypothetical protein
LETRSLLSVFFPALLLFTSAFTPHFDAFEKHREVFGGPHYYLTIAYLAAPLGPFSKVPARFRGTLVSDGGEREISGTLTRQGSTLLYSIEMGGRLFNATREESGNCPGKLHLQPLFDASEYPAETLQFGSCS